MKIYIKKVKDSNDEIKEWIWIRFTHQGKNYRKTLGLLNTKANMKLAKNEIMPTMQLKLYSGELFEKIVPTIDEYSKKSFEIHSVSRKKTTQDDYRISYDKHIKPYLGERKIDSLKPSDISLWQNKVLNSVSASRMKVVRAVLSTILNDALRDEIIERNPLVLVRTPKITKPTISPFSLSEIFSILNNAEEQFKNFFALAFFTGMRSGEMIGLKWENVDFFRKEIYVKQALKMGQVTTPKTVNSVRYVDIVDTLLPYLQMQFRLTGHHKSYVFLNDDNEHFYDIKRIRTTHYQRPLHRLQLLRC